MKKNNNFEIHPQYIISKTGKKTGVILDIATFEDILERLEDAYLGKEAEKELATKNEFFDLKKVKKQLLQKK